MSIQLRDLLARVMVFRPDLDTERGMWALRESAKRLARESMIVKDTAVINVDSGQLNSTLTPSGGDLMRIDDVAAVERNEYMVEYKGGYNPNTDLLDAPVAVTTGTNAAIYSSPIPDPRQTYCGFWAVGKDGCLYVTRGFLSTTFSTLKFDGTNWSNVASPTSARQNYLSGNFATTAMASYEMAVMDDGRIVQVGGYAGDLGGNSYSVYTPSTNSWVDYNNVLPFSAGRDCQYFYVKDNIIAVYSGSIANSGGINPQSYFFTNFYMWDVDKRIVTNHIKWPAAPSTSGDCPVSHTRLADGDILFYIMLATGQYSLYRFNRSTYQFTQVAGPFAYGTDSYLIDMFAKGDYVCLAWTDNVNTNLTTRIVNIATGQAIGSYNRKTSELIANGYSLASVSTGYDNINDLFVVLTNKSAYFTIVPSTGVTSSSTVIGSQNHLSPTPAKFGDRPMLIGGNSAGSKAQVTTFDSMIKSNIGFFYNVTAANSRFNVGDIVYSTGKSWDTISRDKFTQLPQSNQPSVTNTRLPFVNTPQSWTQSANTITWYNLGDSGWTTRVTYSYIPTGEFDEIGVQNEAVDTLIDGALELVMSMPGEGKDLQMAMIGRNRFKMGVNNLKAVAIFGYGGSPTYTSPFFAGSGGIR